MFLPLRDQFLRRDILDLLDNESDFVPMQEIADRLEYPSVSAVRSMCDDLRRKIRDLYSSEEMEFIISVRGGVKLIRHGTNLQLLLEKVTDGSVAVQAALQLFFQREFSVLDYCESHYISKSTLLRKMKQANDWISKFGPTMTFANTIKLHGNEANIRVVHYFFLKLGYETLDSFSGIDNPEYYVELTKKIFEYLKLPYIETQAEHVAFWVFVNQHAVENQFPVKSSDPMLKTKEFYHFIDKPDFLTQWQIIDWELFLLFFYAMGYMPINESVTLKDANPFKKIIQTWISTFESTFFSIPKEKIAPLKITLQRQLQYIEMTRLDSSVMFFTESVHPEKIKIYYPKFYRIFIEFWQNLTAENILDSHMSGFQIPSFFNCVDLVTFSFYMPKIYLFIFHDTTMMYARYVEKRLTNILAQFNIEFVDDYKKADLIISTVDFLDPLTEGQELLQIRGSFSENDQKSIKRAVNRLTLSKNKDISI